MAGFASAEEAIRDFLLVSRRQSIDGSTGRVRYEDDTQPASIRFGKMRRTGQRQLHAVTYENLSGQRMRFIFTAHQDDTGAWHFEGGAGGSANGAPHRGHPWANLGGGGWPTQFYGGGQVLEHSGAVVRVRLRAVNGVTLEDTVDEEDTVLFLTDAEMHIPIVVELLDNIGKIVNQSTLWPGV